MNKRDDNFEFTPNPRRQYRVKLPENATLSDVVGLLNGLDIRYFGTDVDQECLPPGFRKFLVGE